MIYTLTLNPALDYVMSIDNINFGSTNRSATEYIEYGGKGINVSRILKEFNTENKCLGFIAGFSGKQLVKALFTEGLSTNFIKLKNGNTRINIKLKSDQETEINANGPYADEKSVKKLFKLLSNLKNNDILILSGSILPGLTPNIYADIMQMVTKNGVLVIVDTTNQALLNTLQYKPFLIKPNLQELCDIFNKESMTNDEVIEYAKKLKQLGATNVLVSLGKDGAILIDEFDNIHSQKAISDTVINTVGCGDSMIAGFITGYIKKHDYNFALKIAMACGCATAFSHTLATYKQIKTAFSLLEA